jgi:NAD-dependent dihydropyrimidine dehydrogenase PreA subunit
MEKDVYQKLAEKIMVPSTGLVPELFRMLVNEEDGELLLALPGKIEELVARSGTDSATLEDKLQELFVKGLIFKSRKPDGVKYRFCRDVAQLHDATILWPEAPQAFLDLWQRYMEEEWPDYSKMVEGFLPRPLTRVIPVQKSISARSQVLAYESVKELLEATPRIAVTKCTCRHIAHKCDRPVEVCLQLGKGADYALERGTGREVTVEQALDIVAEAEKAGLVHVTMNRSQNMIFLCNCCGCCCITMPVLIEHGRKLCDPSRFRAEVDADACTSCGDCAERCYFGALTIADEPGAIAVIDNEKCMGCGLCQVVCLDEAITLAEVRDREFIPVA